MALDQGHVLWADGRRLLALAAVTGAQAEAEHGGKAEHQQTAQLLGESSFTESGFTESSWAESGAIQSALSYDEIKQSYNILTLGAGYNTDNFGIKSIVPNFRVSRYLNVSPSVK